MNQQASSTNSGGPFTQESLLIRVRDSGDNVSWQLFADTYGPLIESVCRKKGFQLSDIHDITQDVLSKVAVAIRSFDYDPQRGRFRSWLATITANQMRDFARRNARCREYVGEAMDAFVANPDDRDWSESFAQRVFTVACQRIRPTVQDETWACFEAIWMNRETAAIVAERLGLPIHSVYVNKSRVLKKLEAEFVMLSEDYPMLDGGDETRDGGAGT